MGKVVRPSEGLGHERLGLKSPGVRVRPCLNSRVGGNSILKLLSKPFSRMVSESPGDKNKYGSVVHRRPRPHFSGEGSMERRKD